MKYFVSAVRRKYATFGGRARRREFWRFLISFLFILVGVMVVDHFAGTTVRVGTKGLKVGILSGLWFLTFLIPLVAVGTRRLHDTSKSGWRQLFMFVPLIGWFLLLVWFCQEGKHMDNYYGDNPKRTIPRGKRYS